MSTQDIRFNHIAEAIDYLTGKFKQPPGLDEEAENVGMNAADFQQLFTEWAGTGPKKFLQYISVGHAKRILRESRQSTAVEVAFGTGLSSMSRLHNFFISIEGMTPEEYKNGGKNLTLNYSFAESPFGNLLAASTPKGICFMAFEDEEEKALNDLKSKFPNASFQQRVDVIQQNALCVFQNGRDQMPEIKLHLKGTGFQLKVWESLLKIPMGKLSTYRNIAEQIGNSNASRAVGTAIGSNPVAFLIPCHRVIQSTGIFGGYMWGPTRKAAIIGWEGIKSYEREYN